MVEVMECRNRDKRWPPLRIPIAVLVFEAWFDYPSGSAARSMADQAEQTSSICLRKQITEIRGRPQASDQQLFKCRVLPVQVLQGLSCLQAICFAVDKGNPAGVRQTLLLASAGVVMLMAATADHEP